MTRLRQRLRRLEARKPKCGNVIFISTGVPRGGEHVGDISLAFTSHGSVYKTPYETDEEFIARVTGGTRCGR